jgi:transposase
LNHPPRGADVYVEDEAELSLFPTLTRMWTGLLAVRGQQRKIRAPGVRPPKRQEYGAVDWRTGDLIQIRAEKRNSEGFCRLVEKCMARSAARKRRVIMIVDGANFHRPEKARRVRQLCERYGRRLQLIYIPKYSPECMPMELFWNDWRDNVTHNHDRTALKELTGDSDRYIRRRKRNPQAVLRTLGSPFAARQRFKT